MHLSFKTEKTPLQIAKALSKILGHGCAPMTDNIPATVDELYNEMQLAAENHNKNREVAWQVAPWEKRGPYLFHTTSSKRMDVRVWNRGLYLELFSPSWKEGETPYCFFEVTAEGDLLIDIPQEALPFLKEREDRVMSSLDYLFYASFEDAEYGYTVREAALYLDAEIRASSSEEEDLLQLEQDRKAYGYRVTL